MHTKDNTLKHNHFKQSHCLKCKTVAILGSFITRCLSITLSQILLKVIDSQYITRYNEFFSYITACQSITLSKVFTTVRHKRFCAMHAPDRQRVTRSSRIPVCSTLDPLIILRIIKGEPP